MSTDVTSAAAREAAAPTGSEPTRSGPVFLPATNIYETAEGLLLFAEVPGTDPGSISVTLDRAVLRLGARVAAQLTGGQLVLTPAGGGQVRYGGLLATDATGKRLPATLALSGRSIVLTVDDRVRGDVLQDAERTANDAAFAKVARRFTVVRDDRKARP